MKLETLNTLEPNYRAACDAYNEQMEKRGMADTTPVCEAHRAMKDAILPLVPEILTMWEAGIEVGLAFDALAATGGEDEALGDQMHLKFVAFSEAMNTLNRKAASIPSPLNP